MRSRRSHSAFTLIELLTVIAIIGVLAALAAPTLKNFRKGDTTLAATQQLLGAVAQARQLAISQRTTVYLVFLPTNYWNDSAASSWTAADRAIATNLADKQLTSYNFVSLRSVGDQPGRNYPRYLSTWSTLPNGLLIAPDKFAIPRYNYLSNLYAMSGFRVYGFDVTNGIPFPLVQTTPFSMASPYIALPYIGFDYLGRLISGQDEFIPLAHGSVSTPRDPKKVALLTPGPPNPVEAEESPAGNSSNSFNVIHIDWLTGRARLERQEVQ